MEDLIFAIDVSESKKNNFIVIKTYSTNIFLKRGIPSANRISPVNIFEESGFRNFDISVCKVEIAALVLQISANSFYVSSENFIKLFNLVGESIFFIDYKLKLNYISAVIQDKLSIVAKINFNINGNIEIEYGKSVLSLRHTSRQRYNICFKKPSISLVNLVKENVYVLSFNYCGKESYYKGKECSFLILNEVIPRMYQYEKQIAQLLNTFGFRNISNCKFVYYGCESKGVIYQKLLTLGIKIKADKNVISPRIKIERSSSDWFDITLTCNIGDLTYDLASQINLFGKNGEIEIKGKTIVLPEAIVDAKEDIVSNGGRLQISKRNIFSVLRLIYESEENIHNFFSYQNIKLNLPDEMKKIAYNYQIEGAKWLKYLFSNGLGGCLADDMGLGKSFQVIMFLSDYEVRKKCKKTLIIVPKSLLTNWQKEFAKFHADLSVTLYHGAKRSKSVFNNFDIVITTYSTARMDSEFLSKIEFSVIIFDEIQFVKNSESSTSENLKKLRGAIKIGLSGTPMENNIAELWNVMDILNRGVFNSRQKFISRYHGQNYSELKTILAPFVLRRLKKDVLKELPLKHEQIIFCDMDDAQRRLYNSILLKVREEIRNHAPFSASVVLKGLLLLRECCCHPSLLNKNVNVNSIRESCKIENLKLLVNNSLESGHKILIFSQFTRMLKIIKENLSEYNEHIYYLDGKTKDRLTVVNSFENAEKGIFLISIKAGGVGLNLTSAQDVVIYDPWWNPFVEKQAMDRAYRIGQQQAVTVYKLITATTIEEKILNMQQTKQADFDELINGLQTNKNIKLNDLLRILLS